MTTRRSKKADIAASQCPVIGDIDCACSSFKPIQKTPEMVGMTTERMKTFNVAPNDRIYWCSECSPLHPLSPWLHRVGDVTARDTSIRKPQVDFPSRCASSASALNGSPRTRGIPNDSTVLAPFKTGLTRSSNEYSTETNVPNSSRSSSTNVPEPFLPLRPRRGSLKLRALDSKDWIEVAPRGSSIHGA
jgi:hypothetical protein